MYVTYCIPSFSSLATRNVILSNKNEYNNLTIKTSGISIWLIIWLIILLLSLYAKNIGVLYLIYALFAGLIGTAFSFLKIFIECGAHNPNFYPTVFAILIWAILLPLYTVLYIELIHFNKDYLKEKVRLTLNILWYFLTTPRYYPTILFYLYILYALIISFMIIMDIGIILYHNISINISPDFLYQYTYAGVDSEHLVENKIDLNVSLSTNNPPNSSGSSMDLGSSSDPDSGMGTSIGSEERTSSEIDRNIAKHEQIDFFEKEVEQDRKILNAIEAKNNGATLTSEQTTLLNNNPYKDSHEALQEIAAKKRIIHDLIISTGEYPDSHGEYDSANSKEVSSEEESSDQNSSDTEMRRAMDESRRQHKDDFSNKQGESSKKGGSK